jgi:hypothetical protein
VLKAPKNGGERQPYVETLQRLTTYADWLVKGNQKRPPAPEVQEVSDYLKELMH